MPSPPNPPDVDSEEFRSRRRIAEASSWQQVLGVTSTCPESELKKAYRTLALLHHPDKATSEAAATFRAVQRAYEEGLAQQREAKAASLAKPNEVVEASDSERQQWPVHPCASKETQAQLQKEVAACAEKKAQLAAQVAEALQQKEAAEEALSAQQAEERALVEKLQLEVNQLVDAQMELDKVQKEHAQVELQSQEELQAGEALRTAKAANLSIAEVFEGLLGGSTPEDKKLEALKEYLQTVSTEKTLVAASEGLLTAPESRGDFDKMAIDCIKEELTEKLKSLEEALAARAPAERRARAEVLGLQALLEVCSEKAQIAEKQHAEVEAAVKGHKTSIKSCRQQVAKCAKELLSFEELLAAEAQREVQCEEASVEMTALKEAEAAKQAEEAAKQAAEQAAAEEAKAEAEAKQAAEEAAKQAAEEAAKQAAEKAAAEEAAKAAEAQPDVVADVMEPPAKRLRTEDKDAPEAPILASPTSYVGTAVAVGACPRGDPTGGSLYLYALPSASRAQTAHVRAAVDQWEHAYDLGEVPSVPDDVPEVCAAELASWLREGRCVAMDCREPTEAHYERRVPAIPAQLSAPFGQLTGAPERLAPQLARLKAAQTHVVAFSTHGGTSGNCGMCAALLIDVFGMDATRFWRLEGGVDEWIDWAAAHPDAVAQLPAPTI
ncbi:unnamed protein product [Effrenium voratum]|nr:unnamed protein product [Effrenium voratum]